jgi:acyl-CoA synthetase (AMP-forming)/AMP-acid ligase II
VLLGILPFSFDVGLNQLMTALGVGAELVLLDSWLPADITTVAGGRRVTGVSGVPSIWQDLINSGARFDTNGTHASLRYLTVSGGSLSRDYLRKLSDTARGVAIFKTYGQTEAFRSTSLRPEEYDAKPDSVGKPFPGVRVYIAREDRTRCAPGEVGEVVHSGLGIMMGYLGSAAEGESRKLAKNPFFGEEDDSPVAVFTGDRGRLDEEGYLYLEGRADSMLKVMGNRVYPHEVANQILAIDGVREAVVVGVTDENGQSRLLAFLAAPREAGLSAGAVKRALNASLPTFMIPKEIVFVDHVPRTPSGKPDQQRLIEEYSSKAVHTAAAGSEANEGVER